MGKTTIDENILLDPLASDTQRLVNSLRLQIGDFDEEDVEDQAYTDTELYIFLADAADYLSALPYSHGLTFSRSKMEATGDISGKNRALVLLTAELLIQFRAAREGTRSAVLIKEGDTTIDLRTKANVANTSEKELVDRIERLVNNIKFDDATGGYRVDTYDTDEYEP